MQKKCDVGNKESLLAGEPKKLEISPSFEPTTLNERITWFLSQYFNFENAFRCIQHHGQLVQREDSGKFYRSAEY